jgi:methionine-S-sulfoxide reductase
MRKIVFTLLALSLSMSTLSLGEIAMAKTDTAVLAGGCFWGMEDLLRKQPGITHAEVGYTGGKTEGANYNIVKTGVTGHAESVRLTFDTEKTSYEKILMYFFKIHDPTTKDQQGNDVGTQYRSVIFYNSPQQKEVAESVIAKVNKSGAWTKPVVTQVVPLGKFYLAEEYHQDYLVKNPGGYTCHYERSINFNK